MRELVHIQIGQAGNNIGNKVCILSFQILVNIDTDTEFSNICNMLYEYFIFIYTYFYSSGK